MINPAQIACRVNQDGDGFDDGEEALSMGTNPPDPLDRMSTPVPEPSGRPLILAGVALLGLLALSAKEF